MARLWYDVGICAKVALGFLVISCLVFIIGFSTDVWVYKIHDGNLKRVYGMWNFLFYFTSDTYNGTFREDQGNNAIYVYNTVWYKITQFLECFGLIFVAVATFVLVLYSLSTKFRRRKVLFTVIGFTFASVVFILVGVAIFASTFVNKYEYSVGWSMIVAIVGAILALIAGILQIVELQ